MPQETIPARPHTPARAPRDTTQWDKWEALLQVTHRALLIGDLWDMPLYYKLRGFSAEVYRSFYASCQSRSLPECEDYVIHVGVRLCYR